MRPVIGITTGDPSGIGPEVTVKALRHEKIFNMCVPVVIGDFEALRQTNEFSQTGLALREIKNICDAKGEHGTLDYINLGCLSPGSFEYKKVQKLTGEASFTNTYSSVSGVNITIGLPVIRTSVDHGTAFDKAGEGRANEESMVDAIETAAVMAKEKFDLK